jgi:hypothetical protein
MGPFARGQRGRMLMRGIQMGRLFCGDEGPEQRFTSSMSVSETSSAVSIAGANTG